MKSWNYNFSFCDTAITCGPPPPVLYGKVEGSDYRWGASVSYSCAEGYQLSNTAILSCEGRGVWRGDIPQCLRKFSGYSCVGLHQSYNQLSRATVTFSLFKKTSARSGNIWPTAGFSLLLWKSIPCYKIEWLCPFKVIDFFLSPRVTSISYYLIGLITICLTEDLSECSEFDLWWAWLKFLLKLFLFSSLFPFPLTGENKDPNT